MFTEAFTLFMIVLFMVFGTMTLRRSALKIGGVRLCPWKFTVGAIASLTLGIFLGPY